jgi:hypothetical protein
MRCATLSKLERQRNVLPNARLSRPAEQLLRGKELAAGRNRGRSRAAPRPHFEFKRWRRATRGWLWTKKKANQPGAVRATLSIPKNWGSVIDANEPAGKNSGRLPFATICRRFGFSFFACCAQKAKQERFKLCGGENPFGVRRLTAAFFLCFLFFVFHCPKRETKAAVKRRTPNGASGRFRLRFFFVALCPRLETKKQQNEEAENRLRILVAWLLRNRSLLAAACLLTLISSRSHFRGTAWEGRPTHHHWAPAAGWRQMAANGGVF